MFKRLMIVVGTMIVFMGLAFGQASPGLFATNPPTEIVPAPGPAIGTGQVGAPTYVLPPQPSGGFIDIGQIFGAVIAPYINELANALVYAAMGWIFWLLKNKLNINIDAEHRAAFTQAAQRQASSLIAAGAVSVEGKTIHVNNEELAESVNELAAVVPDALAHFGITPKTVGDSASKLIADRITDMIPQPAAGAAMIAPAVAVVTPTEPKAA